MPDAPRRTVLELLKISAEFLTRHGMESARLECDLLLAKVLGWSRIELYTRHDMPLEGDHLNHFRDLVRRRGRHEPMAYLLGSREFLEWEFLVDRRVLIPRPETEHVVRLASAFLDERSPGYLVDLGVGSGCILLSLLRKHETARGVGVDISSGALQVAQKNARRLRVEDRVFLVEADFLSALSSIGRVDLLISNPPYILHEEASSLSADIVDYEPHEALFSPADGLHFHRQIVHAARGLLSMDGAVVLELPDGGGDELVQLWSALFPSGRALVMLDYAGRERVFLGAISAPSDRKWRHLLAS